jgi:fermentation-respiration switch protein FrsA (DUF1100 family)
MFFLIGLAFLYLLGLGWLWMIQQRLMYFPDRRMDAPEAYGLSGFEAVTLTAADGVRVTAWRHPAREGMPLVIYYHGNGGHLGYRKAIYDALAQAGFGVLALSYRGYGTSEGAPSEQGIYADARATLDYAMQTMGVPLERIILFGESLGTGVAVQMASERRVGGVALQSPYTSITKRAGEIYFFVPVSLLLRDRYDSLAKIRDVHSPLLILHGERDMIVPARMGRELLAAANEPKRGVFYPQIGHYDFDVQETVREVMKFLPLQGGG